MRGYSIYVLVILWMGYLLILPCKSTAQNLETGNFFISSDFIYDHWTVEDGLPVNSLNEIIQSEDGYIWFGTNDGLVRFDGVRFKVFTSADYPGMPSNRIRVVREAEDGSLWLKTDQLDLIRYNRGTFVHITSEEGLNGEYVNEVYKDGRGNLWFGADRGISVFRNGKLSLYHPEDIAGPISRIYVDADGVLWFRNDRELKLYRYDGEEMQFIAQTANYTDSNVFLTLSENVTLFSANGDIYRYSNDSAQKFSTGLPPSNEQLAIYLDSNGRVRLATRYHEFYILSQRDGSPEGGRWHKDSEEEARTWGDVFKQAAPDLLWVVGWGTVMLNGNPIFRFDGQFVDFLYDREGSLWLSTYNRGLIRLKPTIFQVYSEKEGVPYRNIYPVIQTRDGAIWIGTHGDGVARIKDDRIESFSDFIPTGGSQYVRTILERSSGQLLTGLVEGGIYQYDNQREFTKMPTLDELDASTVYSLFEDSQERLWAGADRGLFVNEKGTWKKAGPSGELPPEYIRYIAEAPDGTLWMGSNGGGLVRFSGESFTTYTKEHGISSNLIRCIYIEKGTDAGDYTLWVGTENLGLNRIEVHDGGFSEADITVYTKENGLFDNVVHQILPDDRNRFWMSSNRGIFWVEKSQMEEMAAGLRSVITSIGYTEQDGLRNREANGGVQSPGVKARDGTLWFPTQDGVVRVDPVSLNMLPPPVVIEEITSGGNLLDTQEGTILMEPRQRNFEIVFTGLSLLTPEKVTFRYRLRGFDEDWIEAGGRRQAFYTNVPAGDYTFQVMASNNEGVWSEEPAELQIRVGSFFYEESWFYLVLVLTGSLLVVAFVQQRLRHLKKREEELTQAVEERTLELRREKEITEKQAEELKVLNEAKSRFFTNISHEFRTPLTLILSPLQRLKKMMTPEQDLHLTKEYIAKEVDRMLGNSRRLMRLINQILDLAKLESGELKLHVAKIELIGFLRKLADLFKPVCTEQGQTLTFRSGIEEARLCADDDALEQVLVNLISNAIKFTPEGGEIGINVTESPDDWIINISDTGRGIPASKLEHIFERFYQVDSSSTRLAEGTGVGLSLVKYLVELHGGTVEVQSEEGEGSVFSVSLKKGRDHFKEENVIWDTDPISVPDEIETGMEIRRSEAEDVEEDETPHKEDSPGILVVEDNADMRSFIHSIFRDDFVVHVAGDGEEALERIKTFTPNLIIADLMMPKMDGMMLNRELKKDPLLSTIPLIFLTAKDEVESKIEGLEEGADDYLTKPFDADVLVARVNNLIDQRKKLRARYLKQVGIEDGEPESTSPFMRELNRIIQQHFADPGFGIQQLADEIHFERTYLFRKVKEETGLSPHQYLTEYRMKRAAGMMIRQEGNISEIAYASGFNSLTYFGKVFKGYYKMSPSDYVVQQNRRDEETERRRD